MKLSDAFIGQIVVEQKATGRHYGQLYTRYGHIVGLTMNATDHPEVILMVSWAIASPPMPGEVWAAREPTPIHPHNVDAVSDFA